MINVFMIIVIGKMNNSSSENAEVTFRIFLVCHLEERSLKDFSGLTSLKA